MSTLEVSNLNDGTTTVATTFINNGSAKAWANINQVTSGQAIRLSLNLSSLTDEGAATTTVSYTSAFANDDYCTTSGIRDGGGENDTRLVLGSSDSSYTSTLQRVYCVYHNETVAGGGVKNDAEVLSLCLHGDLA